MAGIANILQGRFTADGSAKTLTFNSPIDHIRVINQTVADTNQTTAVGVGFEWFRGMPNGAAIEYKKSNAANAANLTDYITSGGFTEVDSSVQTLGALNTTITAISNAATPVVSLTSTTGLSTGDVVRLYNVVGGQQLGGIDFTIGSLVANTSFTLAYMAQIVAATTGSLRRVPFDPIYYPRRRFISAITRASQAVVTMTVTHGYQVGQEVSFIVPSDYGMVEMDGLKGTITAINTTNNTITVDIDSSGFTAFAFPTTSAVPFTPAQVVPVGMNTGEALDSNVDILSDATENQGFYGIQLAAGADSPAGQANDVIYWIAQQSFSVNNE